MHIHTRTPRSPKRGTSITLNFLMRRRDLICIFVFLETVIIKNVFVTLQTRYNTRCTTRTCVSTAHQIILHTVHHVVRMYRLMCAVSAYYLDVKHEFSIFIAFAKN